MYKYLIILLLSLCCQLTANVFESTISPITDQIFEQMSYSWREDNPVPIEDL